ncbi:MAG: UDP-N-acetylmuramate--L-alanine ligase [Ignavibacteria bacterium]|nr:UDP-N-acetylmuramate--L-alanine ligase [Ignavibacteria bacterium]
MGIGGAGMSGLAEYFLELGVNVSGSDASESHITKSLEKAGAVINIGHREENLPYDAEVVVYTSALKNDYNPELEKAKKLGIRTFKRAEMLGEIVNNKFLIAISGTHGKTTTTAMTGKLLEDAGLDPIVFVGGNVSLFGGRSSRFGKGNFAVVEADEYDRSFLTLKPNLIVITNIEEDHLDIYGNLQNIKESFKKFCYQSKPDARLIFYGDDSNINSVIDSVTREKISYGFREGNYLKITGYKLLDNKLSFSILNSESSYEGIKINLYGKHNILNTTACFAVAKCLNIDFNVFRRSIASFKTVERRLQLKYEDKGIRIYDDYAHHPTEIKSSLSALKEISDGRIISIFQPHLYSRTKDFYLEFAKALAQADQVILTDIYPAREKPIEGVTSKLILDELKKLNHEALLFHEFSDITDYLSNNIRNGDIIVFQGAGDITDACSMFISKISGAK